MNLEKWLKEGKLHQHPTSQEEIVNLFKVIERDLRDASIQQLSTDRRFATAYNAALQLTTIIIHVSGYRTKTSHGHHFITFSLLPRFMGPEEQPRADYFNACRIKRNVTDYDRVGEISALELSELLDEVDAYKNLVLQWLYQKQPSWIKGLEKQMHLLKNLRLKTKRQSVKR